MELSISMFIDKSIINLEQMTLWRAVSL